MYVERAVGYASCQRYCKHTFFSQYSLESSQNISLNILREIQGPKLKRFRCFSGIHPEWVRNRSKPNKTSFMTFQSCHVKTIYNY